MKHTPETRAKIRQTLTGVKHPPERVKANSEGHRGDVNRFNLGALTLGKPSPRAREVGAERSNDQGRVFVKCADGKWRRRAHLVWEATNGRSVPRGRLIHHIDEDPSNDAPANLQLVTRAEHAKIHAMLNRTRVRNLG